MNHYVQYHNPDKLGEFRPRKGSFGIITDKCVDHLFGNRIWLVSRRGKPHQYQYLLCETFIVEQVGARGAGPLRNFAESSHGRDFSPPVRIDHEPWFGTFLKQNQNFRFGLQTINDDQAIQGLLKASER
jgi:hypothetical protein